MQIINVNVISMNCENVYRYLCFCCVDAVDCGAALPRCMDFHPHSRVRHWDRLWSSIVKGEGDSVGCFGLFHPCHPAALWILP